ncbi:hypothetical protein DFQ28_011742 [Apophysomyces sp. BC1034]|nr:hypothetical protein DFQ30_000122 [Apophysomyces sp. BC1015]KAG0181679.1 hypothetical protein DFQ29_007459 [Apophysomyces sp. BC1021]KAG0191494.1 hypothetical protein DFQ28_011742 [Apophysomyces sp. BC1034]
MEYVGKIGSLITSINNFYNEINPATLSGSIDIVVVEEPNGELSSSPFHVRFGKLSVLRPQEKKVEIKVNGELTPYLMKVGEAGEAFFVFETEHDVPEEFQTSPLMIADVEGKDSEDPPYLNIGEASENTKERKKIPERSKDEFDDDKEQSQAPVELQSPKMIIEEQMDKTVTKMDMHRNTGVTDSTDAQQPASAPQAPQNDVYQMDDGSTLLERVIPGSITTTTVAKESFIVRPANGDTHSIQMDVTRMFDYHDKTADDGKAKRIEKQVYHRAGDAESIVLDMAGYKATRSIERQHGQESKELSTEIPVQDIEAEPCKTDSSIPEKVDGNTTKAAREETTAVSNGELESSWGWGRLQRSTSLDDNKDADEAVSKEGNSEDQLKDQQLNVQMKSGQLYRIEMSLCGLSAFGSDEEENNTVFVQQQITFDNFLRNPNLLNDRRLVFRYEGRFYAAGQTGSLFTSLLVFRKPLTAVEEEAHETRIAESKDTHSFGRGWRQWWNSSSTAVPAERRDDDTENGEQDTTTYTATTKATSVGWTAEEMAGEMAEEEEANPIFPPRKRYAKTLRLTSEQLKNLNLKKGVNTITFSVTSYLGTATCAAKVFFWDHDVKVVISDIDGTITKSDALGHVFTMIGKDWTHNGVAKLYTDVHNNGYHFLYLTSRAIGQADYTREYLKKVMQGKYQLPDGPVIMSPDRLFASFHREVIMRKPEVFKMACLRDVQRLFGGQSPFYAGFGNRITDAVSYRSVDVPVSRIFTIDPYGDLKLELLQGFKSSYVDLNDLVDQIFPPIKKNVIQEQFNDWNFWKAPLPEIDIPELDTDLPPTSPKPKPILPDSSSLPSISVVESPPPRVRRKRDILKSLTSRSSRSTTTQSLKQPSPPALKPSVSTPSFLSRSSSFESIESRKCETASTAASTPPGKSTCGPIFDDTDLDETLDALDHIPFI